MVRYRLASLLVLSSTVEGLSSTASSNEALVPDPFTSSNEAFVPEGLVSTSSNEASAPEGLSSTTSSESSASEGFTSTSSNEASAPEGLVSTSSNEASAPEGLSSTSSNEAFAPEGLMSMSMPEGLSSTSSNDALSITGIASSDNTILYELPTTFHLTAPIKIQSNVPVTIQRFIAPFGNVVGQYPINNGAGSILVTSNCDSSETKVVPNIVQSLYDTLDENYMTKTYTITLDSVSNERASTMPFLDSSSYTMEYYDTSSMMGMYTAEDIDPTDPIYSYSPCPNEEACRMAATEVGITLFYVGEYPTGGCFQKMEDKMFWGIVGDVTVPPKGIQQSRVYCKNEVYYIDDIPPAPDSTTNPPVSAPVVEEGGTYTPSSFSTPNFGSPTFVVDWTLGPTSSTVFPTISGPPKSLTPTTSGPPNSLSPSVFTTCMTEAECKEASLAMGIEKFIAGTFPTTKGCFDKYNAGDGTKVAYWSEGGTKEEMSKSDLPGMQERITCGKSDESEECELGPMADSSKSCGSNEFCMLKMGVCNTKIGIFTGVCSIKSEMCPMNYAPVCGCDNITYSNDCVAYSNGTSISVSGECGQEGGMFSASQKIAYPEYIESFDTAMSTSATSSAFSIKGFVLLGSMLQVASSSVGKTRHIHQARKLQDDTCTYNVEVLIGGCGYDNYTSIEVSAPKARIIDSVIEIVANETVGVYESQYYNGTQYYTKSVKNTAILTFPADQEQSFVTGNDIFASAPDPNLEEGTCAPIAIGRPFVDSVGRSLVASSVFASHEQCDEFSSSWRGDTTTLSLDHQGKSELLGESITVNMTTTNHITLGDEWTKNALGEHASVASFAAFSIALMTNNAPSDLVEDSFKAAMDEIHHTKVSFAIASKLLGRDVIPGPLPPSNHQFNRDLTALAMAVAKEGCVDETLSSLVAAAEVELINDVLKNNGGAAENGSKYYGISTEVLRWIRDELQTISQEESSHSALAWRTLDWVCSVDVIACDAVKESVINEGKLIKAFEQRFGSGRNVDYSPELLERMMMTWKNIYSSHFNHDDNDDDYGVKDEVNDRDYNLANPLIIPLYSQGGSYSA